MRKKSMRNLFFVLFAVSCLGALLLLSGCFSVKQTDDGPTIEELKNLHDLSFDGTELTIYLGENKSTGCEWTTKPQNDKVIDYSVNRVFKLSGAGAASGEAIGTLEAGFKGTGAGTADIVCTTPVGWDGTGDGYSYIVTVTVNEDCTIASASGVFTAVDVASETTAPGAETEETTPAPSSAGSDMERYAGTYKGYAMQTKHEYNPEFGSINDYPILQTDHSFRLVLNADGSASWEDDEYGTTAIREWSAEGENITVVFTEETDVGTIRDGIITLDDEDVIWYFAAEGADTSGLGAITQEETLVVLGDDYYFGTGPDGFDLDTAQKAYTSAAEGGVGKGWYCMGRLYQDKTLEEGHYEKAMEYYEKAIELGSPYGLYGKASLYEDGLGVEQDYALAQQLYQQAADAGCLMGYNGLGSMYLEGTIPGLNGPDGEKALECYSLAMESKDWYERVYAVNAVGLVYEHGAGSIPQDAAKELEWYQKAADEGYANAMANISISYTFVEEGMEQDYAAAVEWAQKSADAGGAYGCSQLGYLYEYGLGVDQDGEQARTWYEKGMGWGDEYAAYRLGGMYEDGDLIEQDYAAAMDCYQTAARENVPGAFFRIGYLYSEGHGAEQNNAEAVNWWLKGVDLGDSACAANLGWAYRGGNGVEQNYQTALDYYALAIRLSQVEGETYVEEYARERISEMVQNGMISQEQADAALAG